MASARTGSTEKRNLLDEVLDLVDEMQTERAAEGRLYTPRIRTLARKLHKAATDLLAKVDG